MAKKSTSPWVYVGFGCFGCAALVIGGFLGLGLFGAKIAKDFEEELRDPVKREERAREILGAEELPASFRAQLHFKIPLLLEMVVLSDGEPIEFDDQGAEVESEHLGENAFIYLSMRDVGDAREDFESILEGDTRHLDNVQIDLDFRSDEVLGRGEIDIPPQHLRYVTHRGEFRDNRESSTGTYSVLLVDCPGSSKIRAGFYWRSHEEGQEPEGLAAAEGGDLSGTPYEEGLRQFVSHFELCGEA